MGGIELRTNKRNNVKNDSGRRKPKTVFGRFANSAKVTVLTAGLTVAAPIMFNGCSGKQKTEQTDKKPKKKHPEMQGNIGKAVKPATEKSAAEKSVFDSESVKETAIEAVKAGDVQNLNELLEDVPPLAVDNVLETRDKDGKTLLIIASSKGDAEMVRSLLRYDAGIKEIDKKGKTALNYAVNSNNNEIIELISGYQKQLNRDVLEFAHHNLVKGPLDKGADPSTTDEHGRTPLIIASSFGSADSVKLLLEAYGVDVDVKDKKGETAIMKAARAGSAETIELLIRHGADRLEQNNDGENALMLVKWNGNKEAIEAMMETVPYHF